MPPVPERRHWIGLLQLALGIGLISVLIVRMDNRQDVLTALSTITQRWYTAAAAILCFLGCLLTAAFRRNVFEHFAFFRRLEEKTELGAMLSQIYRAFHGCLTHPGLLTRTLLLSLINHLFFIVAAFLLGAGLQIQTIAPDDTPHIAPIRRIAELGTYLTVFPVINGIATIPATPGGLGTRDAATKFLLGVPEFGVQPSRAVTLSLLLYVITLFWSLVVGIVYAIGIIYPATPPSCGSTITNETLQNIRERSS
ncbi:MAG TPA: hypothetical protein DCS43_08795 [Verrucomicrobia bacterium]|nr:hypothetical protein [Verrucomicrobiota bacterium]